MEKISGFLSPHALSMPSGWLDRFPAIGPSGLWDIHFHQHSPVLQEEGESRLG